MQTFNLKEISEIVSGKLVGDETVEFSKIVTDSRNIINPSSCLFVAVVGEQHDGHNYIEEIYRSGVKAFLVSRDIDKLVPTDDRPLSRDRGALERLFESRRNAYLASAETIIDNNDTPEAAIAQFDI